jgi:hypothetical protein
MGASFTYVVLETEWLGINKVKQSNEYALMGVKKIYLII